MNLEERINEDIKTAIKSREKEKLEALRAIKSAILLAKTEKGYAGTLDEQAEFKLLQKLVKQRKDSAEIYRDQKREDLAEKEVFEAEVIGSYLPEQLDDDELKEQLEQVIRNEGASSMADMGRIMSIASKQFAGKAEGKKIAGLVRSLLSGD
ncbi:MAG: GatB/YqeY domain-containing protein [Bacteroidales bacterium]|nr:MAG: GatB/YqeY domain-containing protein [Bacteroidales bacterium]